MPEYEMKDVSGLSADDQKLYVKNDAGMFVLDGVTGAVSRAKLGEFRDNNITLKNQLDAFNGVSAADVATMTTANTAFTTEIEELKLKLESSGNLDDDAIKKIVAQRVATMQSDFDGKELAMTGTIKEQRVQLEELLINGSARAAALIHGVEDTAMEFLESKANSVWKMEDGKAVPYDSEGKKMYDDTGVEVLTMDGWVKGLQKSAPFLFKTSTEGDINHGDRQIPSDPGKLSPMAKIRVGMS